MMTRQTLIVTLLALALSAQAAGLAAQQAGIAFGGLKTDIAEPVQVQADSLSINQADGSASFAGNVVITQGEMRLEAALVTVLYAEGGGTIDSLRAEGGVALNAGSDSAAAESADYRPDTGALVLAGNVRLTQGGATITGERLELNLQTGLGTMSGGVTTTFTPGGN
jgi:lipopolysaccharide export system protein LptA